VRVGFVAISDLNPGLEGWGRIEIEVGVGKVKRE